MPYDHYLFEMPDMGEALTQITEQKEKIVNTFYLSDSNQVCIIVERESEKIDNVLKSLFERDGE